MLAVSPSRASDLDLRSWPMSSTAPAAPVGAPRRARVLAAAALALAVPFTGAVTLRATRPAPAFPAEWDPRIIELVRFVEHDRGLEFAHPVHVDYQREAEFVAGLREGDRDTGPDSSFDQFARAIGLAEGDVDLAREAVELAEVGVAAYYSPKSQRIRVRGTDIDVGQRVILVHELTHALQDQQFGLRDILDDAAEGRIYDPRALIEGDASIVERHYVDTLSPEQRREYDDAVESDREAADFERFPTFLLLTFDFPYSIGRGFVGALRADGGRTAVDAAFERLPASDRMAMDPLSYRDPPEPVRLEPFGAVSPGNRIDSGGTWGAFDLYLMLAEQIDPPEALTAVLGWGAGQYRVIDSVVDRTCVELAVRGDDRAATTALEQALARWQKLLPHRDLVRVTRSAAQVNVRACDPGTNATGAVSGQVEEAYTLLVIRLGLIEGLAGAADVDLEAATCVADRVLADHEPDGFTRNDVDVGLRRSVDAALEVCR